MTKARLMLILIAAFTVTLVAGAAAGYAIRSFAHRPPRHFAGGPPRDPGAPPPHNRFPDLKLTAEQDAKMDEIWSAVMRDSRKGQSDQRQALQKQREEAVRAILTEEQKIKYEGVLKDYASKIAESQQGARQDVPGSRRENQADPERGAAKEVRGMAEELARRSASGRSASRDEGGAAATAAGQS